MKRFTVLFWFSCFCTFSALSQDVKIMLDPGHGGTDPGHEAIEKSQLDEKELTLKIAQKVGNYLSSKLNHVAVSYTRTGDTYPSLDQRVELANSLKVDYFISIHFNGSTNSGVKGTELHVNGFDSKMAVGLAKHIDCEFKNRAGRKSRGVKDSNDREYSLQVLKYTQMPSVLIECGFLTNSNEAKYVNTEEGQDILASAIFRGIRSFLKENHPQISFESSTEKSTVTTQTPQNKKSTYSVQLMSSIEWIDTEAPSFKKLSNKVERVQVSQTGYKYKYFSGSFPDKAQANDYLNEIVKQGFKDAFVVERSN